MPHYPIPVSGQKGSGLCDTGVGNVIILDRSAKTTFGGIIGALHLLLALVRSFVAYESYFLLPVLFMAE